MLRTNPFEAIGPERTCEIAGSAARQVPAYLVEVREAFSAAVTAYGFPCVGARAVANQGLCRLGLYRALGSARSVDETCADLHDFVMEYQNGLLDNPNRFGSFVAVFQDPSIRSDKIFHDKLWRHLSLMRRKDRQFHSRSAFSQQNTNSPHFAFSFSESAFYVIGLYPAHPRLARRIPWPALVFNPHHQFQRLRERGLFEVMKKKIRERDELLQAEVNTLLADHGSQSEACQYSGIQKSHRIRIPTW